MKYYAIKRPDGTWIFAPRHEGGPIRYIWQAAGLCDGKLGKILWPDLVGINVKDAESAGYRCVEVSGFVEAGSGDKIRAIMDELLRYANDSLDSQYGTLSASMVKRMAEEALEVPR